MNIKVGCVENVLSDQLRVGGVQNLLKNGGLKLREGPFYEKRIMHGDR
jgi:hypothetical protein